MYKINTQILRVPNHYEDMTAQATLSGITVLKNGKFKQRHGGSKLLIQKPREGLILRSKDEDERKRLLDLKQLKKRKKQNNGTTVQNSQNTRHYSINKKEVSHRIKNYVNQMSGEKKLYFWTITFPPNTSDDTAFICFNKWLTRLRKEKMLNSYLWITERQDGKRLNDDTKTPTNTIHFHIAIHQRICVKKANRFMRACLFTCIDNKEIVYSREAAKNYNGVDIAKDRKTKRVINFAKQKKAKSLTNYLTKYISKNNGKFTHLAWHSSRDYSNLIIAVRLTESEYLTCGIKNYISEAKPIENEWFTFFRWKGEPPKDLLKYLAHINQVAMSLLPNNKN